MIKWYCIECETYGVHHYYNSKEELLKAHPVLENAKHLIAYKDD